MLCPRRDEFPGANLSKRPDRYRHGGGLVSQPRACSFCGFLPPEDFMHAVRFGAELGPTDKTYKVYLKLPGSGVDAKFYFQHLSADQQREFVELLNERPRRFTISYPGRFYVLPFFVQPAPAADT